jgi:hypothetical protein
VYAPDDDPLTDVAASIADGDSVEWRRLREHANAASGGILRELEVLEAIASFHRSNDTSESPTTATVPTTESPSPRRWRHLTLVQKIGDGGSSAVYRAYDANLQTDVALKLVALPADRMHDVDRALGEARLLARIRHPHVVRVFGADIADGYVGVWMEYIEGETLARVLRARGPFGAQEAAVAARDLCQAVAAVHAAHLVHGDIKAHNVMREAGGRIVLMDFGTGKDTRPTAGRPIRARDVIGTPLYLAPEVFRGETQSVLSDIYSLGVLVYHLVTNAYPYEGKTLAEVVEAQRRGQRKPVRDARPDLPPALVDIIECATAVDPRERYQSAGAFDSALARFLDQRGDRSALRPWLAAAAAMTIAVAGGARLWFTRPPVPQPVAAVEPQPRPAAPADYRIATTVYRHDPGGGDKPLRQGDAVSTGDELYAVLRVSAPTYVYIVNEDENGNTFVLFPLPGQAADNPLTPDTPTRIPGTRAEVINWQINSSGGKEHFLIFANPSRLQTFEELFSTLPRPSFGKQATATKLPATVIGKLRGVGGLTSPPPTASGSRLSTMFTQPLRENEERAEGLIVRQLTVQNPAR